MTARRHTTAIRLLFAAAVLVLAVLAGAAEPWQNPLVKQGRLGSPLVETTPFVFQDRLYLLENNQRFWDIGGNPGERFAEDEVRVRDLKTGNIVSVALTGHGFGTALVSDGRVYVFAGDYGQNKPWRSVTEISMTSSEDLIHWTKPVVVLRADEHDQHFWNTAVARGPDGFVLLVETSDKRFPQFTFRYLRSDDLVHWKPIPDAFYGKDRYVGGPALYHAGDWYYTLYLEALGNNQFETRITRSKDLIHWQDAPADRPFVTFDPSHQQIPLLDPQARESNASDVELTCFDGRTIVYFTGSDQSRGGDLQWATFEGTPRALFERFFEGVPALVPSAVQQAYQERQFGAIFGIDFFIGGDLTSQPPAASFNPAAFDAEQVVLAAKSFGARYLVFHAKVHNGFCFWPTKTTDYCVRLSPWRGGRGDMVRELTDACRKHGLDPVVYVSTGDKNVGCSSTPLPLGERTMIGDPAAYWPLFERQLTELLTQYGDFAGVWFDGAHDPFGWDVCDAETGKNIGRAYGDKVLALVRRLQPRAAIFGGVCPDVRWSGSEQGWAAYPLWNAIRRGEGPAQWVPDDFAGWSIPEANIHTRDSWLASTDNEHTLASVERLMQAYDESVGRGANLLVSVLVDKQGVLAEAEKARLAEFGQELSRRYGTPAAQTRGERPLAADQTLELALPGPTNVETVILEEDLSAGQNVAAYTLEARAGHGSWVVIAKGQTIGRKRIEHVPPATWDAIRVRLTELRGPAVIRSLAAFGNSDAETAVARDEPLLKPEQMQWLVAKAHAIHDASIMKLADGTRVYSPMGYGGVWPRDMYYTVAGVPEKADMAIVAGVIELCLQHQRKDGSVPKNIAINGEPGYVCWAVPGGFDAVEQPLTEASPIWDGQRPKPEGDSGQFLILLAHEYWKRTGDKAFLQKHLANLRRAMDAMPRDASGLIWIDPRHPHTTYGFTDNVGKTGNELFCSLLYWQASGMLAEMARSVGDEQVAQDFAARAALIEQNIDRLKDPVSGMYFAATEVGRQIDIWGNAYLVYIGFPDAARRERICRYLAEHRDEFVAGGQVRHLKQGEYWQKTFRWPTGEEYTHGMFQNGAYWGTATGWVGYAIAQVDRQAAAAIFRDLIEAYQAKGIWEFMYEDGRTGPMQDYAASVVNPLDALRRIERKTAAAPVATSDTVAPKHEGNWAPVLIAPTKPLEPAPTGKPEAIRRVPTPQQLQYQNAQLGAFVHFGPATYIQSDMMSTPAAGIFNPEKLDAEQWVRAAKSFGARHIVLTAKHHNGFCLWPTATTDYCVRSSPWKNGRGDVVRELAEACRKHQLKLGIYLSGGDKHFGCSSTPDPLGERKLIGDRKQYFPCFMEQLRELLTGYGELAVVWFDGAHDPFGWDVSDPQTGKPLGLEHGNAIAALVRKLQPNAVIFGGVDADVRWSGSEQGWAPYPLWNLIPPGEGPKNWVAPANLGWRIPEANIHTRDTWFWVPNSDQTLRGIDYLMQAYDNSIGRGANLLINMTPDTTGLIPAAEVQRLAEFGKALADRFGTPLATADSLRGWTETGVLELILPQPASVANVVIEEDIARGQHIRAYTLEALVDDTWRQVASGESIGRQRIEKIEPVTTTKLRLRVTKQDGEPAVRAMRAYRSAR